MARRITIDFIAQLPNVPLTGRDSPDCNRKRS